MGQSLRLLLIEDDAKAAALLCDRFRADGMVIEHAANGADGLALAQKGGFDVLVVDRMLPELSGTQLVENLRQAGDTTPVLFLSALGEVDDRVAGFEAGGDDYLTKPLNMDKIGACDNQQGHDTPRFRSARTAIYASAMPNGAGCRCADYAAL